ncbi:MAG: hypothetical protein ACI9NT_000451, partial [Bacteroidia bacterium]
MGNGIDGTRTRGTGANDVVLPSEPLNHLDIAHLPFPSRCR